MQKITNLKNQKIIMIDCVQMPVHTNKQGVYPSPIDMSLSESEENVDDDIWSESSSDHAKYVPRQSCCLSNKMVEDKGFVKNEDKNGLVKGKQIINNTDLELDEIWTQRRDWPGNMDIWRNSEEIKQLRDLNLIKKNKSFEIRPIGFTKLEVINYGLVKILRIKWDFLTYH